VNERRYPTAYCRICGALSKGEFHSPTFFCPKHERDEVNFYQSLQDSPLTKEQKAQRRLYEKRWR